MKELNLGKEKINKLLLAFSLPCVVSMLINSVYNIVDQIFIGKGVGTLGNAATNVLFPLIMVLSAIASLIGNGAAANLSLKLGENKKDEAAKSIGISVVLTSIVAIILSLIAYLLLPTLIYAFGSTDTVYPYALDYGKILLLGAPFMIIYSSLSSIIRADGSPKYSMIMLVVGAVINLILDPIFIFGFNMGVKGGALATVISQGVSFIIAIIYLFKVKSVKLNKASFKLDKTVFRILSLGLSSFITQLTVLILFIFMNNILTTLGANSKFGADIPLSVYGVLSKVNSLFISTVLGISIGAQPIIGFNYGAGNKDRVKETLKKVLIINFSIGIIFNIIFVLFPTQIASLFISPTDASYNLFMEFSKLMCRSFLLIIGINALEMTTSVLVQALGKVVKATSLAFIRQILLFIPIALILGITLDYGIYGVLYAGVIADLISFIIAIFVFRSEYKLLSINNENIDEESIKNTGYNGKHIVITISREYGSGGRFVGEKLAKKLGVNFYDKEIITLAGKESGLDKNYIGKMDEKKDAGNYELNNDDKIYIAEKNIIESIAKNESCVIVGRCADYILRDNKDTIKIYLYSSMENKIKRACEYYNISKKNAEKEINKINKERSKHYEYYTGRKWRELSNYDLAINVDSLGIDKTVDYILNAINK